MKKIMLAVCLMFGSATLVSAQETQSQTRTQSQTETSTQQDQEGQQISVSELPDAVTAKLESQDYSGWTVGNVYKKMDESQNEIYVVEMRQGTETKKVKFDRDGNKLEKSDKHKGDKHQDESGNANYRDNSAEQDASSQEDASQLDETEQDASDATEQDATEQEATDQADNTESEPEQQ